LPHAHLLDFIEKRELERRSSSKGDSRGPAARKPTTFIT
jgi:hypothetical protein